MPYIDKDGRKRDGSIDLMSRQVSDERISFTVPASGRRYTIHVEDWESIKVHIEIATAARGRTQNNTPKAGE